MLFNIGDAHTPTHRGTPRGGKALRSAAALWLRGDDATESLRGGGALIKKNRLSDCHLAHRVW